MVRRLRGVEREDFINQRLGTNTPNGLIRPGRFCGFQKQKKNGT